MYSVKLTCSVFVIWLFSFLLTWNTARASSFSDAAQELITGIEKADPSTQTQKDAWAEIRKALEKAGQEAESEAGLKLSFSRILDHWEGKAFRILDQGDAQYWALGSGKTLFSDLGATFQSRGPKWTVQYIGSKGQKFFRRGDEVKTAGFHPMTSPVNTKKIDLELQSSPMSAARRVSVPVHTLPFADYVLAETQAAGTLFTKNNQRICLQKAWFWINDAVAAHLVSKINFQSENCAAQLIDLRDAFGQDPAGTLKTAKKIPTVVLINQNTREGAARFAQRLKKDLEAQIIGETSGNPLLPEQQWTLKSLPWNVLSYGAQVAPLQPDTRVKDSLVYAEGMDTLHEAGLSSIDKQIKK